MFGVAILDSGFVHKHNTDTGNLCSDVDSYKDADAVSFLSTVAASPVSTLTILQSAVT